MMYSDSVVMLDAKLVVLTGRMIDLSHQMHQPGADQAVLQAELNTVRAEARELQRAYSKQAQAEEKILDLAAQVISDAGGTPSGEAFGKIGG